MQLKQNCKGSSQIHITHIRSRAQCYQDLLSHPQYSHAPILNYASLWMLAAFFHQWISCKWQEPQDASLQQPYLKGKMWPLLLLQKKSSRQWLWLTWAAVSQAHAKNVNILPIYKYITWKAKLSFKILTGMDIERSREIKRPIRRTLFVWNKKICYRRYNSWFTEIVKGHIKNRLLS